MPQTCFNINGFFGRRNHRLVVRLKDNGESLCLDFQRRTSEQGFSPWDSDKSLWINGNEAIQEFYKIIEYIVNKKDGEMCHERYIPLRERFLVETVDGKLKEMKKTMGPERLFIQYRGGNGFDAYMQYDSEEGWETRSKTNQWDKKENYSLHLEDVKKLYEFLNKNYIHVDPLGSIPAS